MVKTRNLGLLFLAGAMALCGFGLIAFAGRCGRTGDTGAENETGTVQGPPALPGWTDDGYMYEAVIEVEGMEETVWYANYRSDKGYAMAYDVERFAPEQYAEYDLFAKLYNPSYLADFIWISRVYNADEGAAEAKRNALIDAGYSASGISQTRVGSGGYLAKCFSARQGEVIARHFFVDAGNGYFTIVVTYTQQTAEGYGTRMLQMLNTFEQNVVK